MEDVLPGNGLGVVKARYGDDLRRFIVTDLGVTGIPNYVSLENKLKTLFGVKSKKLRISYLDKDGDTVTMACDADLRDALVEQQLDPLRLTLQPPRYHHKNDPNFENGVKDAPATLYKISRAVKTVPEVWEEYTKGLNGGPAVSDLERDPAWKKTEKQYLSRRRALYENIRVIARNRKITPESAAQVMEQARIEQNQTLAQMQQELCDKRALEFGRKRKRLDEVGGIPPEHFQAVAPEQ